MTTFEVNGIKCGVAICYDVCFGEFIKIYMKSGILFCWSGQNAKAIFEILIQLLKRQSGCDVLFLPAAYDINCWLAFWDLFQSVRAVGNQLFVAAISPARNEKHEYVTYGHSMFVDLNGEIKVKFFSTKWVRLRSWSEISFPLKLSLAFYFRHGDKLAGNFIYNKIVWWMDQNVIWSPLRNKTNIQNYGFLEWKIERIGKSIRVVTNC